MISRAATKNQKRTSKGANIAMFKYMAKNVGHLKRLRKVDLNDIKLPPNVIQLLETDSDKLYFNVFEFNRISEGAGLRNLMLYLFKKNQLYNQLDIK